MGEREPLTSQGSHLGYGFFGWLILEITSGEKKRPSGPDQKMNRKRGEGLSLKGERGVGLCSGGAALRSFGKEIISESNSRKLLLDEIKLI